MSDLKNTTPVVDANIMLAAFAHSGEETVIVKAEDIPMEGGGMDYKKSFFEPQVGQSYTVKLLTNPFGIPNNANHSTSISHRKIYKSLPDPKRKGKNFQFVSSGNAKTCKALECFFDLNNLKKNGDALAEQKIEKFMGATNQGAVLVQVLGSPVPEEVGMIRIMTFSTFGPNATVANLINEKLNPTAAQMAAGFEKEDVFSLFGSNTLIIQCDEAEYEGNKGRDFSKTVFSRKESSPFVTYEKDGNPIKYTFSKEDLVNGQLRSEAVEPFQKLIEQLSAPEISIWNMFCYKEIGDPKNTEDTEKYLVSVHEKVDEIIPIIKNAKSIAEILQHGVAEQSTDSATMIGGAKAADILKDSAPSELLDSVLGQSETTQTVQTPSTEKQQSVDDILGN